MEKMRDYNKESEDNERKYFYGFDIDVMHPYDQIFQTFFWEWQFIRTWKL